MLEYRVSARRIDSRGSEAATKDATITLNTDVNGRPDAFNPVELLLAAIAACMIKGIERVTPMLKFKLRGVEIHLRGMRQDSPPKMAAVDYELIVDTDEDDRRLELLHLNVRKFGTIFNTVAAGDETRRRDSQKGMIGAKADQARSKACRALGEVRIEAARRRQLSTRLAPSSDPPTSGRPVPNADNSLAALAHVTAQTVSRAAPP